MTVAKGVISSQCVKLLLVVLKCMEWETLTPEYFSQGDRSTPLFPRDVTVKPTAHNSRINSTGPVKFRKLRSVGRVIHIHQSGIKRYHLLKVKKKKKKSQEDTRLFWK